MSKRPAYKQWAGHMDRVTADVVTAVRVATRPTITPDERERLINQARADMRNRPGVDWQWELGPWLWRFVDEEEHD